MSVTLLTFILFCKCKITIVNAIFSYMLVNPRTAKLFQLTFAAKEGGVVATPWILVFPTEFLSEIFHGYSFGVKESKGDSKNFLSLSRDLETQGH